MTNIRVAIDADIMKKAQIDVLIARYEDSKGSHGERTQDGIECFEKAVELGYKGDYIDIANAYFYDFIVYSTIKRDYEKAKAWYERYLSDFENELIGTEKLFDIYNNLGVIYFTELINKKNSDALRDDYVRQGMTYWRKAVLVAESLQNELSFLCNQLRNIAFCFKSGTFKENTSGKPVDILVDYEYAFKAFSLCLIDDEDDIDALYMLADMYINGLFVKQDIFKGEEYYWRVVRYILQWVNCNEDSDRERMIDEIYDYFNCNYRISEVSKHDKDEWNSHIYDFYIDEEKTQCLNLGRINQEIQNMDTWMDSGKNWGYWRKVLQKAICIVDADNEHHKMMKSVEDLLRKASSTEKVLLYDECMDRIEKLGEVSYDALKLFIADIMQQGYSFGNREDLYFEAICSSLSDIAKENGNHIQYDILSQAFSDKEEHEQYVIRAMDLLKNKGIVIDDLPVFEGRDKCDRLRTIRKRIAEENGIDYNPTECHHIGPCRGTCPKCDSEIQYLDAEIQKKKKRGEEVKLSGLASDLIEPFVHSVEPDTYVGDLDSFELGNKDSFSYDRSEIPLYVGEEGVEYTVGYSTRMRMLQAFDDWTDDIARGDIQK